jgi:hypothetical protein
MTLGAQFDTLMRKRIDSLVEKAAYPIAEEITELMKRNTKEGTSFTGETYDVPYSESYAKTRKRKGLQTSKVEMRSRGLRIEYTTPPQNQFYMGKATAEIGFVNGGNIFKYHQDGIIYKNGIKRTRTIFPRSWASVPVDIVDRFKTLIVEVLSGRK